MKMYYVVTEGKKYGPFTKEEVFLNLKENRISLSDIICDENDFSIMLMMHPDFLDEEEKNISDNKQEVNFLVSDGVEKSITDLKGLIKENFSIKKSKNKNESDSNYEESSYENANIEVADEILCENEEEKDTVYNKINSLLPDNIQWFTKEKEEKKGPFNFFDMVTMLMNNKIKEYSLVSNSKNKKWKKIAEFEDFKSTNIAKFKKLAVNLNENEINFRRHYERVLMGKPIVIYYKKSLLEVYCVDLSLYGLSIMTNEDVKFPIGTELYVRLDTTISSERLDFDAIYKVVSVNDMKLIDQQGFFSRFGLVLVKLSKNGKNKVLKLINLKKDHKNNL